MANTNGGMRSFAAGARLAKRYEKADIRQYVGLLTAENGSEKKAPLPLFINDAATKSFLTSQTYTEIVAQNSSGAQGRSL